MLCCVFPHSILPLNALSEVLDHIANAAYLGLVLMRTGKGDLWPILEDYDNQNFRSLLGAVAFLVLSSLGCTKV